MAVMAALSIVCYVAMRSGWERIGSAPRPHVQMATD